MTQSHARHRYTGFTIVELLIVIIIIGILAAITIVAYNGIQGRARDSQRVSDMQSIVQALELYKTQNGTYPSAVGNPNAGSWEVSTTGTSATTFLNALVTSRTVSTIPVDPINTGDVSSLNPTYTSDTHEYFYFFYSAGAGGCDTARGAFYVLGVTRFDNVSSGQNSPSSPGFRCTNKDWSTTGAWVTGRFING